MRDKRIKLFNILIDLANKRGEIDQFEQKYKDYNGWESFNFKNDQSVTDLYNKTIKLGIISNSSKLEDFFKKFACDILKTSTYCGGASNSGNNQNTNRTIWKNFPCVTSRKDFKDGATYTYTSSVTDFGVVTLNPNGTFTSTGKRNKGVWSCTKSNRIFLDDTKTASSNSSSSSNNTTITNTNLTANDLTSGSAVKVGMRGDIVTKIQELLIAKGFIHVSKNDTADGIFGNRTKRMVMAFQAANGLNDDGVVGKLTWAKLNDGSAASNSSTNQAASVKDPYEVPGSDSSIMQESRKKILRKYLQEFK